MSLLVSTLVLEINIKEVDYSIEEGESENPIIRVQYRRTQNDFTLNLYPVSITVALDHYKLQAFLPATFTDLATEGVCVAHLNDIVKQHYGECVQCEFMCFSL